MEKFTLKELPFSYDGLEPYISKETLTVHHDKHHQAYTDKFNATIEAAGIEANSIEEIFSKMSSYPVGVKNNGGGYWNHQFYWESMTPNGSELTGELKEAIEKSFGSFEEFKEKFSTSAATLFGSGWTWLGRRENGELVIFNTINQENSLMDVVEESASPLLVIDVWEHAYYLDYQNRRPEHINQFFNVINWEKVSQRFKESQN